jgi:hypothetical protein
MVLGTGGADFCFFHAGDSNFNVSIGFVGTALVGVTAVVAIFEWVVVAEMVGAVETLPLLVRRKFPPTWEGWKGVRSECGTVFGFIDNDDDDDTHHGRMSSS